MADNDRTLLAQGMDETDDIPRQLEDMIHLDGLRLVGLAITTLVWCHHVVPCLRERRQLVAPGVPALWKAVAQDDQRSFALLGDVHPDTIRVDEPVAYLYHHCAPRLRQSRRAA
jgi:hypothetical protein